MKTKKIIVIALSILLILPLFLTAQNKLDSLLEKYKGSPDTTKARILNEFCWNNRSKTPQLALKAGEEALKIAKSINNLNLQA